MKNNLLLPTWSRCPVASTLITALVGVVCLASHLPGSELRRSAIVRAVTESRPAIVSIHGHKTVSGEQTQSASAAGPRRVNGMGTGVVIDERGYVITNFHVVEGVGKINVTLSDGRKLIAKVIAHDPLTDLAVIKLPVRQELPLIKIGSSADLMAGEEVIAVGNAYGYEHTVTRGIISALNRTVPVGDDQKYYDLIQTDASINPGNSGGPLLNIDGEMIGINVAVRVGAQGIGFAIPVDKALEVVARMISAERLGGIWHGVIPVASRDNNVNGIAIRSVEQDSPAGMAGLAPGDVILRVNNIDLKRELDLERSLVGVRPGQEVALVVSRNGRALEFRMTLTAIAKRPSLSPNSTMNLAWDAFGLRLSEIPNGQFRRYGSQFKGGLRVVSVRPNSAGDRQGIRSGDILVGMHKWETASGSDLSYILRQPVVKQNPAVRFYILRGRETLFGQLPVTLLR